jgi:hypothetical protein
MQTILCPDVARAWEENQQKQITSEAFVELSYRITDPDLPETDAEDNGALARLSDTREILRDIDRDVTPYATLEQNLWLLDGSMATIPSEGDTGYSGYISNLLCDRDGFYSANPIVRIVFDETVKSTLPGLTITCGFVGALSYDVCCGLFERGLDFVGHT